MTKLDFYLQYSTSNWWKQSCDVNGFSLYYRCGSGRRRGSGSNPGASARIGRSVGEDIAAAGPRSRVTGRSRKRGNGSQVFTASMLTVLRLVSLTVA